LRKDHAEAITMRIVTESNSVSAGWGSDLVVAAVAAMAPLMAGMFVLLGYIWLGGFGVLLGVGAFIAWGVWWFRKNNALVPRQANLGAVGLTAVLTIGSLILVLSMT
jgi:hypothetical protein